VLDGTGNAATFTGSFNEAGAYSAQTVADELYCVAAMDGTHVVVENPSPTIPDVTSEPRECPGTVTLSASSSGAVVDWYTDAAATTPLYTGISYTTPEIEMSTTYYVQARIENTACLSAREPVLATVIMENCCHEPGVTGVTFAKFSPCAGASYGSTYTLTDDRDQKTYKVKYMPDGRYWMVQDLMFGNCKENSWKNDQSEAATKIEPTVASGYVGHCRTSTVSGGGYMYNWTAAMNNSLAYQGSTNNSFTCSGIGSQTKTCQGICPSGWHVPTGNKDGEILSLAQNVTTHCASSGCNVIDFVGAVRSGWIDYSGSASETYMAVHWSSSRESTSQISVMMNINGLGTQNLEPARGANVRCVMNY
jgi:uncharacterized protein (TIGR02145 family)